MKKRFISFLAMLLSFAMIITIAGCSGGKGSDNGDKTVSAKDTLTVGVIGDRGTLLPTGMRGSGLAGAARMYCEPLWEFTAKEELNPVLAEKVEGLNSTTWKVYLKKNVKFSNGSPFTAQDVFFTMETYKAATKGQFKEFNLEKSKIIDDYTIEFILEPFGYTMQYAMGDLLMFDKETFDEAGMVMTPIGTGPYAVDEYVIGSHLYLKARDDYWGDKAKIANLHFEVFNEDAQITNALQAGEVDYVAQVPNQDVEFLSTLPGYKAEKYYTMQAPNISFNLNEASVMNNLDARLAVCFATNRQAIIDLAYFKNATLLRWPVSEHSIGFEESLANLHEVYSSGMNIDRAKEYAEKAALVGKDVVVITNGASNFVTTAEILQSNLDEIGVNVIINNYDAASFNEVANDPERYDIVLTQSASSAGLALSLLVGTMMFSPTRYEGWADFKSYYDKGMSTFTNPNETERQAVLREIAPIFINSVVWYGICDVQATRLINEKLEGIIFMKTSATNRYDKWYFVS